MIYAIGYQKLSLEYLLSVMESRGVDLLVDVRSVPYSRRPDFNLKRLKARLQERYVWMGEILGGKRGPATEAGLQYLMDSGKDKVLLVMCMEFCPCDCHRLYDIARRLAQCGVQVLHIYDGREYTTEEMEEFCHGKDRTLFDLP